MLSSLISLTDLNIHMSKTPYCDLKNGGPASYNYFFFCYKLFTGGLENLLNFTDTFVSTTTSTGSDYLDVMIFVGDLLDC